MTASLTSYTDSDTSCPVDFRKEGKDDAARRFFVAPQTVAAQARGSKKCGLI